jgi:SAM-dependent methyltransferase
VSTVDRGAGDPPADPSPSRVAPGPDGPTAPDGDAFLTQVMADIDREVRRRRASGDLPVRVERELDQLFLEFSPLSGRDGRLTDALRLVDAAAFVDPVVPVGSRQPGGAAIKKTIRSMVLWYMGFVVHQVNQFASAVSRALHATDEQLGDLRRQLDSQRVPPTMVVEVPSVHHGDAWWVGPSVAAFGGAPGRVLHAAAGDGWLVARLAERGVDAYGIDPRPGAVDAAVLGGADLREEPVVEHLRAVESAGLGGLVLSGVVDGMTAAERERLLDLVADVLTPGGTLVVHSLTPAAWQAEDAPVAADLSSGRPLRPRTWSHVLAAMGFAVAVHEAPDPGSGDYLVVAVLDGEAHPPPSALAPR